ncbi:hypothetical protein PITC_077410 [Penicillium italicum]|uniref:Uncharacterized protein n=1 Tax=Penicillium italicum TaxID=40296 RepID=A0A0A2KM55_PENIT|nr:hypothetical protein PITC_077410 [Penicillium italicum]
MSTELWSQNLRALRPPGVRSILVGQCRSVEAIVKSLTCRKCMHKRVEKL